MKFHSAAVPVALFCAIPAAIALIGGALFAQLSPSDDLAGDDIPAAQTEVTPGEVAEEAEHPAEAGPPPSGEKDAPAESEKPSGMAALRADIVELTHARGAEHAETLKARHRLAKFFAEQGKFEEARAEYEAVMAIRERVLGAEADATLRTRHNLAIILTEEGKHAESVAEFRAILAIQERDLGPEHASALRSKLYLGRELGELKEFADCEAVLRPTYEAAKRVLGEGHDHTSQCGTFLGVVLIELGKPEEGETIFREALAPRMRALVPEDTRLAPYHWMLGTMLVGCHKPDEALIELEAALAGYRRLHGDGHKRTKEVEAYVTQVKRAKAKAGQDPRAGKEEKPAGEAKE